MEILGIIPARYGSTRFPGKPLVEIKGKIMIQRTWEQAKIVIPNVIVATDDKRVITAVRKFGGEAVMTSVNHQSGTDRCNEAAELYKKSSGRDFDCVINIQGDEPFIQPEQIELLICTMRDEKSELATLKKRITKSEDIFNPNIVKVVVSNSGNAIYFSRSAIPYLRGENEENWGYAFPYFKHIGMYGYKSRVLNEITQLKIGNLEMAEKLEQNRWIENGYQIKVAETKFDNISIDTPEDLINLG